MKSLTREELAGLFEQARQVSELDYFMLLVTFNHGLRACETISLDRSNIQGEYLVVQRLKKSEKTTQPLMKDEKAALLALASVPDKFFDIEADIRTENAAIWSGCGHSAVQMSPACSEAYDRAAGVSGRHGHP